MEGVTCDSEQRNNEDPGERAEEEVEEERKQEEVGRDIKGDVGGGESKRGGHRIKLKLREYSTAPIAWGLFPIMNELIKYIP